MPLFGLLVAPDRSRLDSILRAFYKVANVCIYRNIFSSFHVRLAVCGIQIGRSARILRFFRAA